MPVNVGSITAKFNAAIGSSGFKTRAANKLDGDAIAAGAGAELASAINSAIGVLSGAQQAAVGTASVSGVSPLGGGIYQVGITIPAQFRPSLMPEIYGGVTDMAALFNNGYSAHPLVVYYPKTGEIKRSRPSFPAAHFVQNGVAAFGGGSGDYEVISIDISGRFQ